MHMTDIIPAILPKSYGELEEKLDIAASHAHSIQIDVCDGYFVPSRTWPMNSGDRETFKLMVNKRQKLPYADDFAFDLDLMVHSPENVIRDLIKLGAARVSIHIEAKHDFAACRRAAGDEVELGVALVADTPLSRLEPFKGQFDYIQLMGIASIGKQAQPFDERVLERIREAKRMFPGVPIQIDGSVNADTAPRLIEAGADRLVSGSYILRAEDPKKAIKTLAHA